MRPKRTGALAILFFPIALTFLLASAIASQPAQAQTFKVLHRFHGAPNDGAFPWTQLDRDTNGNLYGTTEQGGNGNGVCVSHFNGCGTVFRLSKSGKLTLLHSFNDTDGADPVVGVLRDKEGNLYGTTALGGDTSCYEYGCGTVFKLDKAGKETVLYAFRGTPDGWFPEALLVADEAGNLYGTAYLGGSYGYGEAFRLDKSGIETILHSFAGPPDGGGDGAYSYEGVLRDGAGNLYSVTDQGGGGDGTVYELDATGKETLLYSFGGSPDGNRPSSVLIADAAGNLYGTTEYGGNGGCTLGQGCGVVFKLTLGGGGDWTESILYTFCSLSNCADGQAPMVGPLLIDPAGNLYGTTVYGGASSGCDGQGCGVVFKLDTAGKETVLHSFTGGADGGSPTAGLIMDRSGILYGTALSGGDLSCPAGTGQGCGVAFKITP
jgi:uncharacterized repeat protein (TIGR03803 family)